MVGEDSDNSVVDACTWGQVGALEHTLDVSRIDFDAQSPDANEIDLEGLQCVIEALHLKLVLGEL